jgi:PAS domain S-box-containing protein
MNLSNLSQVRMTETWWKGIILGLSGTVILFTVWCLSNGITTVFMHLYYFPVVLLAYRYRWKGFVLATLLALVYLGLVLVFDTGQTDVILGAVYRVLVFVGIAAVIAYLSERLAIEKRSAQESTEIREQYISLAPAIILVLDRNGAITFLNRKGGEILECIPGEVTGKSWFDQFLPEHDRERVKRLFSKLVAGQVQSDQAFENPVLTRGGTEKTIRWHNTVLHDERGTITGTLDFGEDITDEKRAQDTQRQLQQFQESVIANANVWISVLAPDGSTLLVWNDAAEAISGYKKSDIVGKNTIWKQLYPDRDYRRNVTSEIQRIIGKDDFLENFETEIHCADGTTKTIVWNTRALRDAHSMVTSYIAIGRDITEQKRLENELRESEGEVRKKLAAILEPEGDIGALELSDIFDQRALQALMDDFFRLTGIGVAILDNAGKILVATGWQDICTKFHRVHPETREYCIESDLTLTQGIEPGKFKLYKCKNNLWDISTPIIIGGNHAGYLFLGQFFFDDEKPDTELFRRQAQRYGFDEQEYLSALDRVPRWKRDTVENVMQFYVRLIGFLSTLSYNNTRLARILNERDTLLQSLKDSENRFHTMADWTYDWEYWVAPDQKILYMSPSVERITGFHPDEFIADPDLINRIIHPDDRGLWETHIPHHHIDSCVDDSAEIEIRIIIKNGSIRWIGHICRSICSGEGIRLGRRVSNRDITYKKHAEEDLRFSNVILSTQQETSPDGILIVDENAKILNYNQSFVRIFQIPENFIAARADEPVRQHVTGQIADPETFLSRVRYLYEHQEEKSHDEIRLKDGRVLEWYSAPMLGEDNRYFGRVWYFHDITERKRGEEALRESEERFRGITERISDLIIMVDPEGHSTFVSPSVTSILGFPPESFIGKRAGPDIIHKDDVMKIGRAMENLKNGSPGEEVEFRMLKRDGSYAVIEGTGIPVFIHGMYSGVQVVARDITERKHAEEEIKRSMERFKTVMDSIDALVYVADLQTYELLFINKYGKNIWGEIEGKTCWQTIQSGQKGPCPFCTNNCIVDASGQPTGIWKWEFQNTVNGHWYDCRDSAIRWLDGRLVRLEIATDITDRKRTEEALLASRQLFSDIISFLPDPTFVIDRDGKVLAWNRALEQLSGVPAGDIIGKGNHEYSIWLYGKQRPILIDLVLRPDMDEARLNYTGILWEGRTVTAQTEIVLSGRGHKTSLSFVASPLIDPQGKVTGAIESLRDITRLMEAEAELARINQNLEEIVRERTRALEEEVAQRMHAEKDVQDALRYTRSVIEANPDLMVVLDRDGTVLDVNAAAESLTGNPREQLIGTRYFRFLVDDGTHTDAFARLLELGKIEKTIQIQRNDGHATPVSVNATVIRGSPGTGMQRIIVSGHDITRQKQDEEAIRASLDEKVVLLREVHHRVKNNLQIIISLTNLQMRQTDDLGVKQIMAETQNRVRAMSLVHEKLYRSENLSQIDFADYTHFLATQLFSFYGTDTRRVRLDLSIGKIMVDINTAVPLGLLMNELVSNALKHAFPNGRKGTISISGGYEGDLITLIIRDNGVGIPEELDWKNTTSLGMRLVTSLIDQVDGTITLDRKDGTTFTVTVKREPAAGGTG